MGAVKKQKSPKQGAGKPAGISSTLTKVVRRIKNSHHQRVARAKKGGNGGIIMLSHIPHGFFERELAQFFGQFGKVRRTRVARSRKTGMSQGYAFVEFQMEEVAKIAAESMDNYLMFDKLVKCKLLGREISAKRLFAGAQTKFIPGQKRQELLKEKQEIQKSAAHQRAILEARVLTLHKQNSRLAAVGIDYQFTPPELPSFVEPPTNDTEGTSETPAAPIKIFGRKKKQAKANKVKKGKKDKTPAKSNSSEEIAESPKGGKSITKKPKAKKLRGNKDKLNSPVSGADASVATPTAIRPKRKQSVEKGSGTPGKSLNVVAKSPASGKEEPLTPKKSPIAKSPKVATEVLIQNVETTPVSAKAQPSLGSGKKPKNQSLKQRRSLEQAAKSSVALNEQEDAVVENIEAVVNSPAKKNAKSPKPITATPSPGQAQKKSPKATKLTPKERKSLKLQSIQGLVDVFPQPKKSPKVKKSIESVQVPSLPSPKGESPQAKKRKSDVDIEESQVVVNSPKTPKLSLTKQVPAEPEPIPIPVSGKKVNKKAGKKSEEFKAKMSPKLLRSKNRQSESIIPAEVIESDAPKENVKKSQKKEKNSPVAGKKDKPKFSPKVLRSKGKKSEILSGPLDASTVSLVDVQENNKSTSAPKATKTPKKSLGKVNQKSPNSPKESKLPKFSPKILRNRAGRQSESSPAVSNVMKGRKSMK